MPAVPFAAQRRHEQRHARHGHETPGVRQEDPHGGERRDFVRVTCERGAERAVGDVHEHEEQREAGIRRAGVERLPRAAGTAERIGEAQHGEERKGNSRQQKIRPVLAPWRMVPVDEHASEQIPHRVRQLHDEEHRRDGRRRKADNVGTEEKQIRAYCREHKILRKVSRAEPKSYPPS